MKLSDYQDEAIKTAKWTNSQIALDPIAYCALKLAGEAGEVAEKIGKAYRDHEGKLNDVRHLDLLLELGDVLWYVSAMAKLLDVSLEYVAELNLEKLADRQQRRAIGGSGDHR